MRYESSAVVDIRPDQVRQVRKLLAQYAKAEYDRNGLEYYHSDVTSTPPFRALLSCARRNNDPETIDGDREAAQAAAVDAIQHALHDTRATITPEGAVSTETAE